MTSNRVSRRMLGALVAGGLVFGACSSDDDTTSNPTDSPTDTDNQRDTDTESSTNTTPESSTASTPDTPADSSPASSGTIEIVDAQDRTVEVPVNPETVVVIDWGTIRTLNYLGIEVDGVSDAPGTLPDDVADVVENATIVGNLQEPDYEAIAALEPDLIITGSRAGTPEVVAELEKISPAVIDMTVRFDEPADQIRAFRERTLQLASIWDQEAEATEALDQIEADIAEVAEEASDTTAMIVMVTAGTVASFGAGHNPFGMIYDTFGFAPTDAPVNEMGAHGQEISQEFFVQYNPEAIFVLDRGSVLGEEGPTALDTLNNGLVNSTDAATNDKIISTDGFSWYVGMYGIPSIQEIIEEARLALG